MSLTIYHNPRCSKSRQTLALIEEAGHSPEIVLYFENPLAADQISALINRLGLASARDLMRRGEAEYKELGLKSVDDENELIAAMAKHPRLIERPIVDNGKAAILGRPPENVKKLL